MNRRWGFTPIFWYKRKMKGHHQFKCEDGYIYNDPKYFQSVIVWAKINTTLHCQHRKWEILQGQEPWASYGFAELWSESGNSP